MVLKVYETYLSTNTFWNGVLLIFDTKCRIVDIWLSLESFIAYIADALVQRPAGRATGVA